MRPGARSIFWLAGIAMAGIGAAATIIVSGVYNVAAVEQHTAPVFWTLYTAMRQSVRQHAAAITPPPLSDPAVAMQGRVRYDAHCRACHGAPGVAADAFALGLTPAPLNLANVSREWPDRDLFWVVKNGIKMSAMPAWEFRFSDDELWSLVAYLKVMPAESPAQYRAALALAAGHATQDSSKHPSSGSAPTVSAKRGKVALLQYGCATCHDIPGVVGADAPVGPPLAHMARRGAIAGLLTNDVEHMVAWIREPQRWHPGSAMPDLGVSEADARDMASYLYSLD